MAHNDKPNSELPVILFEDQKAWEEWLSGNFSSSAGVWLRLANKSAKFQTVIYQEAVEVALCYGWIDSQAKGYDEESHLQKFTPRGPKSIWSKINRAKALELIENGRMQPAGLAAINAAKESGRWKAAYDPLRTATTPDDLQAALDKNPNAAAFFATLNSQNRYAILHRIQMAKKAETRQKRIDQFIQMLGRHEKLYP
jgi:uncharacterized protein YdeI (YjbR/CyaY-like superfamily)